MADIADNLAASAPSGPVDEFAELLKTKTIDELIAMGVELRDERKAEAKRFKKFEADNKAMVAKISMQLKAKGDELGVNSFSTSMGTAYRNLKESYRVGVWDEILGYIIENKAWHMLEKRVGKLATKEIHKSTGVIPPGVQYIAEEEFLIRRPNERGNDDE